MFSDGIGKFYTIVLQYWVLCEGGVSLGPQEGGAGIVLSFVRMSETALEFFYRIRTIICLAFFFDKTRTAPNII